MTAKEYLSQYRELNSDIDLLCAETERLRCLMTRTSSGAIGAGIRAKGRHRAAKFEDMVDKLAVLEGDINEKIDRLVDLRAEIEGVIAAVEDGTLRKLLRLRYIAGYTWERVAAEMNYSYVHIVHNLHPKALKRVNSI